jgi:hypothetical protein
MEKNYVSPSIDRTAFHCPHCGTKAPMKWYSCYARTVDKIPSLRTISNTKDLITNIKKQHDKDKLPTEDFFDNLLKDAAKAEAGDLLFSEVDSQYCGWRLNNIFFSVCQETSCGKAALWVHDKLVIPASYVEEPPNEDMPEEVKAIYNEARAVHSASPRASAALLRLCCEMLCDHLQAKGKTLNDKIADLVTKGMDSRNQKTFDILRHIGNDVIHPGQIDLRDDIVTSRTLFLLVNEITQEMISKEKRILNMFNEKLPQAVRDKIAKRDTKKP